MHKQIGDLETFNTGLRSNVVTVRLQFNSHKSVQKLFHNLSIIFSNSLMGFKVVGESELDLDLCDSDIDRSLVDI